MSAPIFRPLTYDKYAASPEYGGFRASHPNIALSVDVKAYSSGPPPKAFSVGQNCGLRTIKYAPLERMPFPCTSSKYRCLINVNLFGAFLYTTGAYLELEPPSKNLHRGESPSCKSRRALGVPAESIFGGVSLRPRKLDEKLNRHGRSARRVAFLRPCRDFSQYRSPLDYVSAIPKILVFV